MRAWDSAKVCAALELLEQAAPSGYSGKVYVHFKDGKALEFDPSGRATRAELEHMAVESPRRSPRAAAR